MHRYNIGLVFAEIVKRYAAEPALLLDGELISYGELDRRSNRMARYLLYNGLVKGDVMALSSIKNITTYTAVLACLKLGVLYIFLDRESPRKRLQKILTNSSPKYIAADPVLRKTLGEVDLPVLDIHGLEAQKCVDNLMDTAPNPTWAVESGHPAYIMYTSGSTGFPKGVTITHGNLIHFVQWSQEEYGIGPGERLTNVNPLFFDNSVFDLYSGLFTGACLVPFARSMLKNPIKLAQALHETGCTSWFSVPSLLIYMQTLKAFKPRSLPNIRRFIFGGEGYPKAKLQKLFKLYGDHARLYNVYGPTECTCMCSSYEITPKDFENMDGLPPLGRLFNNFSYVILDENDCVVDEDKVGELFLMGDHVGAGYYRDEERSGMNFVQNPVNDRFRQIGYRTGDLVCLSSKDGFLYFVGRKDTQIKHMGYRIELGEIESALNQLDYVEESAVIYVPCLGSYQLQGFFASKDIIDERRIKEDLGGMLPGYMIPQRLFHMQRLPKNANGKIDRKILAQRYSAHQPFSSRKEEEAPLEQEKNDK